jgi:hypothetical protein
VPGRGDEEKSFERLYGGGIDMLSGSTWGKKGSITYDGPWDGGKDILVCGSKRKGVCESVERA